jgi:hypothetical protein
MRTHPQLHTTQMPGTDRYAGTGQSPPPARGSMTPSQVVERTIHNMQLLSEGMAGMVHANDIAIANDIKDKVAPTLPDDPLQAMGEWYRIWNDEITRRGRARGVPMPDLNSLELIAPVQFIFPHYFLLPTFGNMSSYRIRPLTAETCLFEIWSLVLYPEGETRERPVAPVPMAHDDQRFPPIPQQDYSNLPLQQLGLHSNGFEYMRLSKQVEGLISNYQRTLDGYLGGVEKDKLTRAVRIAAGGMDDPIMDIGF